MESEPDGRVNPTAALLMLLPGAPVQVSLLGQLRHGLVKLPFVWGWPAFTRFMRVDADMKRRHARHLDGSEVVLDIVGVHPAQQGRSLGSLLLGAFTRQADDLRRAAYVITHNPRNLPLYARFGFVLLDEAPLSPGAPSAFSLRRPAAT